MGQWKQGYSQNAWHYSDILVTPYGNVTLNLVKKGSVIITNHNAPPLVCEDCKYVIELLYTYDIVNKNWKFEHSASSFNPDGVLELVSACQCKSCTCIKPKEKRIKDKQRVKDVIELITPLVNKWSESNVDYIDAITLYELQTALNSTEYAIALIQKDLQNLGGKRHKLRDAICDMPKVDIAKMPPV